MKIKRLFIFTLFILACNNQQNNKEHKVQIVPDTSTRPYNGEDSTHANAEIIEIFVDSSNIGQKGECKIELIKHRVLDGTYVIIKFYTKGPKYWYHQNTYLYECTALMDFQPDISDFNNDHFNDITFISGTAARGANEVRRLFIYDDQKKELISIVNAQEYPNIRYNKTLNCIDAFLVHGTSTTVFAHIVGDSLQAFAEVYNGSDFHQIMLIDKNGKEKEIQKVKSKGEYMRFKNFKPLEEYDDE